MKYGYDVREYLNPKYTPEQISEVSLGLMEGLDVSKYAGPRIRERMAETRIEINMTYGKKNTHYQMENGYKNLT